MEIINDIPFTVDSAESIRSPKKKTVVKKKVVMSQAVNANKLIVDTVLMAMNQFYRLILFIAKLWRPRIMQNTNLYAAHFTQKYRMISEIFNVSDGRKSSRKSSNLYGDIDGIFSHVLIMQNRRRNANLFTLNVAASFSDQLTLIDANRFARRSTRSSSHHDPKIYNTGNAQWTCAFFAIFDLLTFG